MPLSINTSAPSTLPRTWEVRSNSWPNVSEREISLLCHEDSATNPAPLPLPPGGLFWDVFIHQSRPGLQWKFYSRIPTIHLFGNGLTINPAQQNFTFICWPVIRIIASVTFDRSPNRHKSEILLLCTDLSTFENPSKKKKKWSFFHSGYHRQSRHPICTDDPLDTPAR